MDDSPKFTCEVFHTEMPIDAQPGFCARRQRKASPGDYCGICPTGIKAAKDTRDPALNSPYKKVREDAEFRERALGKTIDSDKEEAMAGKKLCLKGCGKGAVKDDLCTRHYKEKHGVVPFPSGNAKKKTVKTQAGRQGPKPSPAKKPRAAGKYPPTPSRPATYLVEIDFENYPKLHERLLKISSQEHRTPDMQLVHMLDETFTQAEAGARK